MAATIQELLRDFNEVLRVRSGKSVTAIDPRLTGKIRVRKSWTIPRTSCRSIRRVANSCGVGLSDAVPPDVVVAFLGVPM